MKKKYFIIIILLLFNSSIKAQISTTIDEVFLNNQTTVINCSTLDFGSTQNNSLVFYFKLTRPSSLPNGTGTLRIMLKFTSSSNPQVINSVNISDASWTGTIRESTLAGNIGANQVQLNGSEVFLEFETSGGIKTNSCSFQITKAALPTFTLSQSTVSVGCNDLNPRTFTVTSANIPNGATLTYQWSNTGGWTGSSTSSSITLTPTSGTSLPGTISVIPVLNGISQPQLNCSVTRASFTSFATISGTQNICTGTANYSIAGITAGQTVSWSLSNPSIGTLSNQSNTGVTVTFNGNGAQTLQASVRNQCNQLSPILYVINSGATTFSSPATLSGSTASACSGSRIFTINNLPVGQNVSWSISNPAVATLSGISNTQATLTIIGSGSVNIIATITNSCGQNAIRTATLYGGVPTLSSFTCDPQGKPFCDQGQINEFTSNVPSLNLNDRVTAIFGGQTATEANLNANWEWQALNNRITLTGGTRNFRNIGCVTFGITGLQVRARNSCGWSAWYPLNWELVEVPDGFGRLRDLSSEGLIVSPNPTNNAWNFEMQDTAIDTIDVFDISGKKVYSNHFFTKQATVDSNVFTAGLYFGVVTTSTGQRIIKLVKK